MKPTMNVFLAIIAVSVLSTGCAQSKVASAPAAKPPELFSSLSIGMARVEVEHLLGSPIVGGIENDGKTELWYLPPPKIREIDSPWGPGAIMIVYRQDKVIEKKLNRQGMY